MQKKNLILHIHRAYFSSSYYNSKLQQRFGLFVHAIISNTISLGMRLSMQH